MNFDGVFYYDDFFLLEGVLPILTKRTNVNVYDFDFRRFFDVKSICRLPEIPVVSRTGAYIDYHNDYRLLNKNGLNLIHTPEQHDVCSLLPNWYPLISDLTPKSIIFEQIPSSDEIENTLGWPIFVKGERQTSKHKKSLSIIESAEQFNYLKSIWLNDPILSWQKMVCREFVELEIVEKSLSDTINSSYEFRLFFWKKQFVCMGRYWYDSKEYTLDDKEKEQVIRMATTVAERVDVIFLAVDVALSKYGKWIVIEINDGQESGLAGCNPNVLWTNIIEIEKKLL